MEGAWIILVLPFVVEVTEHRFEFSQMMHLLAWKGVMSFAGEYNSVPELDSSIFHKWSAKWNIWHFFKQQNKQIKAGKIQDKSFNAKYAQSISQMHLITKYRQKYMI